MDQETTSLPALDATDSDDPSDGLVAVVNSRGKIVSCTPALGSVLGYGVPELLGKAMSNIAADAGRGVLAGGRTVTGFAEGAVTFSRRDGKRLRMFCQRSPYLSGSGETYAFIDCRLNGSADGPSGYAGERTAEVSVTPTGAAAAVAAPAAATAPEANGLLSGEQALLKSRIRRALREGEFVVHYQPLLDLVRGVPCGIEALVRWQTVSQGLVGPGGFLPFAEESGQIQEIGAQVLRAACLQAKGWLNQGTPAVQLGVNVSRNQLADAGFVRLVDAVLAETGFPARLLELEVAEKTLTGDHPGILRTLASLREVGVTFAVDDFGTRFSAFDRLRLLPLGRLKIARAFIREMAAGSAGLQIVAALLAMGHSLGADVAAEGVETADQVQLLRQLGCRQAQGFYFGKAVPAPTISGLFRGAAPGASPLFS